MMCSSSTLQEKSEKDWSVFLKCDNGKYTSINSTYDKCLFSKNHFYCVFKTLLVFSEAGMILANTMLLFILIKDFDSYHKIPLSRDKL